MKTEYIKTIETSRGVIHYSCNSPSEKQCKKLGIVMIGEAIGRAARELLLIPVKLFKGGEISEITAEHLMRDLTEKERK